MNERQRSALEHLANLTELGEGCSYGVEGTPNGIQLFQMGVTNADMKHFALLPDFQVITLRENYKVNDTGFKHLSNQKDLRFLDISETNISTLNPIKEAYQLRRLLCDRLEGLTDRKASVLEGFHKLEFLDLSSTKLGDATLKRLAKMHDLRTLNLTWTKVTDKGLRHLAALPKIEVLGLYYTMISNEGLMHLHGLKQLRLLVVGNTQVTEQGKTEIRGSIPSLKVVDYESIYQ